jgi:hypothetical protein
LLGKLFLLERAVAVAICRAWANISLVKVDWIVGWSDTVYRFL